MTIELGYALAAEEHDPIELVDLAMEAERAGFGFATEKAARRTALELWPNAGLPGKLSTELPAPKDFEQAAKIIDDSSLAESIVFGPDPRKHLDAIEKFADAGYDHVSVHQIGPDQKAFLRFYESEILPHVGDLKEDAA